MEQLALMLLEEISQTGQNLIDELENIITYLGYCCWKKAGEEKIFEIRDEAIKQVSDLVTYQRLKPLACLCEANESK